MISRVCFAVRAVLFYSVIASDWQVEVTPPPGNPPASYLF